LVVFVNPSTPDGEFYNLDRLMNIWIKREATIIIDESFLDFTTFKSAIRYLREYNRVYIIKSMTKFYSSAGVRIGLVISNSKNIDKIKESEPLWKISQFDSQYIQSVLRDREFPKISRELNNRYKKETIDILEGCNFVEEIYPSSANFILIRLKDIDSKEFQKRLTPYKIMVRDCFNFDFLDSRYVRVAIKDKKSIDRLRSAICEISI
jgi:threonine-phosphate decarboxylase